MLGWDRTAGNMMEQSIPFLSLFWLNVLLSPYGGMASGYITALGWAYVALRSLYPVRFSIFCPGIVSGGHEREG